jgi:hypothetical protein
MLRTQGPRASEHLQDEEVCIRNRRTEPRRRALPVDMRLDEAPYCAELLLGHH